MNPARVLRGVVKLAVAYAELDAEYKHLLERLGVASRALRIAAQQRAQADAAPDEQQAYAERKLHEWMESAKTKKGGSPDGLLDDSVT